MADDESTRFASVSDENAANELSLFRAKKTEPKGSVFLYIAKAIIKA